VFRVPVAVKLGQISGRDNNIRQWAELGEFQSITDAARRVLQLEEDPLGALFFRVYVDPPGAKPNAVPPRISAPKASIYCYAPCSDFPEHRFHDFRMLAPPLLHSAMA
jgi:hypothetical protein